MEKFERSFYKTESNRRKGIEQLQKMPWFEFLKSDVRCGKVLPALRYDGSIHFYYKGARLCEYDGNIDGEPKADRDKKPFNPVNQDAYERIKKECERWSETVSGVSRERTELSKLYSKFSPYVKPSPGMILLDIEVGFPYLFREDKEIYTNTQVDLLFLDKNTGMLYFVEAKEASDSRIKRKYTGQPAIELYDSLEVAEQLNKYNANLAAREDEILAAYRNYLDIMREIFGLDIYSGKLMLYKRTKLLIYGKSSSNGLKSLEAIRTKLGDDLIVFEAGLGNVNDLSKKITTRSSHT